ncbi:MAG: aminodeoxychorismate/anthranilate synthase component II [Flavobacteriales bacterium CG_4_10_14_0_2_um_filter_32_8]|nr:MAG: aminodeoxychorismate/anthranilate synthase component II [Flavobacteriales bacterium CG_4_10_14_0_2_um_filter_32_8]PJB14436.1 MAG: aminodeoxychorismate/anthranilate synthase component II [Flavobacteriales bacterium CG_4_9_14_3_um_filter_32_8]
MKKILVIDNYDSFTYNLVHYIESNPSYKVDVFRNDEITLDKVGKYNTIILSPGPGLPKDAGILHEVIKTFAPTKKILGVCLGMQAIGEFFGATLVNLSNVYHGIATPIQVLNKECSLFKNLPQHFIVGRYHSWVISRKNFPKDLIVTSIAENEQIMSIQHKKYNIYGVQFHPESILTEYGKDIIANFLAI